MLIGIDVSKYNIGWSPTKAIKPIGFVIQRASYGIWKDEQFDAILPEVQRIKVRGSYHYFSTSIPWKLQADKFLSIVQNKGFHFYAVDYERSYNVFTKQSILDAISFAEYVKVQTGKKVLMYFNPDTYKTAIAVYGINLSATRIDGVWIAQYPYAFSQTPLTTKPYLPAGLTSWVFWQYGGADVPYTAGVKAGADYGGGLTGMDLNYFNGEQVDLDNWAGVNIPVPTPPQFKVVSVLESGVKVPKLLDVNYTVSGVAMSAKIDQRPPVEPEFPHDYEILNDPLAGIEPNGDRPYIRDGVIGPPTVKLQGGSNTYRIPDKWVTFLNNINSLSARNYLWKLGSGWQNGEEDYIVRTITFAGNRVRVKRIEGNRAYIETVSLDSEPPVVATFIKPTEQRPNVFYHMFTIQYIVTGSKFDPNSTVRMDYTTDGRNATIVLFNVPGEEYWIDARGLKRL